jgi:signal transduction histidine kinase
MSESKDPMTAPAHRPAGLPLPPERMLPVLHALQRVADASARPAETGRLYRTLAEAVGHAVRGAAVTATLDAEAGALRLRAGTGAFAADEGELLPVEASIAGAAFVSGQVRTTRDVSADADAFLVERGLPVGPYLAAPLMADGRAVGVALAGRAPGQPPFDAADVAALELVAGAVAGAIAGAEVQEARRRSRAALGAWRAERQLRDQAARLQAALGLGGVLCFEYDRATGRTAWASDVASALGLDAGAGATLAGWIDRVHPEDRARLRAALDGDDPSPRRVRMRMADGQQTVRIVDVAAEPAGEGVLCVMREAERPVVQEVVREVVKEVPVVQEVEVVREVEVVKEVPVIQQVEVVREVVKEVPVVQEVVREVEVIREVEVVKEVLVPAPFPQPVRDTAMLQAFIRAVRHELNNPLAVVTGEAQLLKREWIVQAEVSLERPVNAIHDAAQRLCDLAARLAAVERDPDALVITSEGSVALRPDEPAPSGNGGEPAGAPVAAAA